MERYDIVFWLAQSLVAPSAQSTVSVGVLSSAPFAFPHVQPSGTPREKARKFIVLVSFLTERTLEQAARRLCSLKWRKQRRPQRLLRSNQRM